MRPRREETPRKALVSLFLTTHPALQLLRSILSSSHPQGHTLCPTTWPSCVLELLAGAEFLGQGCQPLQPQLKQGLLNPPPRSTEVSLWRGLTGRHRGPHVTCAFHQHLLGCQRPQELSSLSQDTDYSEKLDVMNAVLGCCLPTAPWIVNQLMTSNTDSWTQDEAAMEIHKVFSA